MYTENLNKKLAYSNFEEPGLRRNLFVPLSKWCNLLDFSSGRPTRLRIASAAEMKSKVAMTTFIFSVAALEELNTSLGQIAGLPVRKPLDGFCVWFARL